MSHRKHLSPVSLYRGLYCGRLDNKRWPSEELKLLCLTGWKIYSSVKVIKGPELEQ